MNNISPAQAYDRLKICSPSSTLEDIITTSALYSYWYARYVLHHRFPIGEDIIATSPYYSYWYAHSLNIRFLKGEKIIITDPNYALWYAKNILGRRWLKAEPIIRKSEYWSDYKRYFDIK